MTFEDPRTLKRLRTASSVPKHPYAHFKVRKSNVPLVETKLKLIRMTIIHLKANLKCVTFEGSEQKRLVWTLGICPKSDDC
jgi:hypothetical protein